MLQSLDVAVLSENTLNGHVHGLHSCDGILNQGWYLQWVRSNAFTAFFAIALNKDFQRNVEDALLAHVFGPLVLLLERFPKFAPESRLSDTNEVKELFLVVVSFEKWFHS